MEQQNSYAQPNPPQANHNGDSTVKNLLTIIILVIAPPIGILVMWFVASWSKKTKLVITGVWLLIIAAAIGLISLSVSSSLSSAQNTASEARLRADFSQLRIVFELLDIEENRPTIITCQTNSNLSSICDDIEKITGSKPTLHMSSTDGFSEEYCGYVRTASGDYYCADSTTRSGKTTVNPGTSNYCNGISFSCPAISSRF